MLGTWKVVSTCYGGLVHVKVIYSVYTGICSAGLVTYRARCLYKNKLVENAISICAHLIHDAYRPWKVVESHGIENSNFPSLESHGIRPGS